jgi:hypothetical protein
MTDSDRLNWIEEHSARVSVLDPPSGDAWVWQVVATDDDGKPDSERGWGIGRTLRRAIDEAMGSSYDPRDEMTIEQLSGGEVPL